MKYSKKCDCCGQQITAYIHNLNQPLVSALRQLVDFYEAHKCECNISHDLSLTHNQIANFQKLKHFGLVELLKKGGYFPTEHGIKFIYGDEFAPTMAASMGNETLPVSHPAWDTHPTKPIWVSVKEIDNFSYKQKSAYREEKSNQVKLL